MKTVHLNEGRSPRKGVVLLVVLAMLTLFATVAIAFVTLSESTVTNMAVGKAAQTQSRPEADLLFSYALSQLVFENENPKSALWTHSLVRDMYGSGNAPFSGLGRVRLQGDAAYPGLDDPAALGLPSAFFRNEFMNMQDRSLAVVTPPGTTRKFFNENGYGNLSTPYTYPDHDHAYLGAFTADGVVIERSFVRRPSNNYYQPPIFATPNTALADPYAFDPSNYANWWVDNDTFMINGAGTGLIQQAIASGGPGTPEWNRLYQELRRRKALVLRPRPGLQPTNPIFGSPPNPVLYQAFLTNLGTTAANAGGTIAGLFHPTFPAPEDQGGDVKNLAPHFVTRVTPNGVAPAYANNDSYWIDLGFPEQTDPNTGRRYKPLFAFFITDLDGCVNMNFHGNSVPAGLNLQPRHASNQGWGPWEVNLSRVLYPSFMAVPGVLPEYPVLHSARPISLIGAELGRLGVDGVSGDGSMAFPANTARGMLSVPHYYGQLDYSARDQSDTPQAAQMSVTAGGTDPPTLPSYPLTYRNADPFPPVALQPSELINHYWRRQNPLFAAGDRFFGAEDMEALLRHGDTGSYGLHSDLRRLLPLSFKEPYAIQGGRAARYQVTTHSFDVLRAGLSPFLANQLAAPLPPPVAPPFPNGYPNPGWHAGNSKLTSQQALGDNLPLNLPLPAVTGEFGAGYKAVSNGYNGVLSRINLNRYLRPYPHLGSYNLGPVPNPGNPPHPIDNNYNIGAGTLPNIAGTGMPGFAATTRLPAQPAPVAPLAAGGNEVYGGNPVRFDLHPAYLEIARAAERDRQILAMDIYRRLVAVSGVQVPTIPADPNDPTFNQNLRSLRMLAQLAANIVDYLDEDDIATPFNFYLATDAVGGVIDPAAIPPLLAVYNPLDVINPAEPDTDRQVRRYWVYGTEMPRLVLSEALAEFTPPPANGNMDVRFWLELASTLPDPSGLANNPNPFDLRAEPLFVPAGPTPATQPAYAPYQVVIAGMNRNEADGPLAPTANQNYNTVGVWHKDTPNQNFRFKTDVTHFQTAMGYVPDADAAPDNTPPRVDPARVRPGQRIIIGPQSTASADEPPDARQSIHAGSTAAQPNQGWTGATGEGRCPRNTPFIRGDRLLTYAVNYQGAGMPWQFDGQDVADGPNAPAAGAGEHSGTGVTILLRRLANPYLPYQGNPGAPDYNPYITVDFISRVRPNNTNTANYSSVGKFQLFASNHTQLANQQSDPNYTGTQNTAHNLGGPNLMETPFTAPNPFDWLTHLDRKIASIGELLQVSGFKPHELTQRFVTDVRIPAAATPITGDPTISQVVNYEVVAPENTGLPLPEIRPGMILRIGGNAAGVNPEYVGVLAVNIPPVAVGDPPLPNFRAVFVNNHNAGEIISVPHAHRAPWLDGSRRLIRALEFLDASIRYQTRVPFRAQILGTSAAPVTLGAGSFFYEFHLARASFVNANGEPEFFEPTLGSLIEIYDATLGLTVTGTITNLGTTPDRFQALVQAVIPPVHELYVNTQSHAGRVPGKININAIRSPQVWQALCDYQTCNTFNPPLVPAGLPAALPPLTSVMNLTLPVLDPSNTNFPYGIFNSVPWTIAVGTKLEFRNPVNGPETVTVTAIAPAGAVIPGGPGVPPSRPFQITFNPPLQAHLLAPHRQPYPAGVPNSSVFIDNASMMFDQLVLSRDGNFATGYVGRPFQGFTRGERNPIASGQPDISLQTPNGSGIVDSFFRPEVAFAPSQPSKTMFEVHAGHPMKRFELASKILGNTTSRSNVFAVWVTVGFFDVTDNVGTLGAEIGRANGRHVRHRMFAIVDRSVIDNFVQSQGPNYNVLTGFGGENFLLGNKQLDPRKGKRIVDRQQQALYPSMPEGATFISPRPDPLGLQRQLINLGQNFVGETAAQMGVGVGQRLTVQAPNGAVEHVTVLAVEPAPTPNMVWVKFQTPGVAPWTAGTPVRVSCELPAAIIHWSVIE